MGIAEMMKFVLAVFAACQFATMASAQDIELEVGQVWTIQNAPSEATRVWIGRIEAFGNADTAVHITLYDLPRIGGFGGEVSHLPFDEATLRRSLDTLIASDQPNRPNFEMGYDNWKDAEGGVFTITVSEVYETVLLPQLSQIPTE
jgi:hypothetical protein